MQRRIFKEIEYCQKNKNIPYLEYNFYIDNNNNNRFYIEFTIKNKESFYNEQIHCLQISVGNNYPYKYPNVVFLSKIFHPNINIKTGAICVDILGKNWSPIYKFHDIYLSVRMLLEDPNPSSALNFEASHYFIKNEKKIHRLCKITNEFYKPFDINKINVSKVCESEHESKHESEHESEHEYEHEYETESENESENESEHESENESENESKSENESIEQY